MMPDTETLEEVVVVAYGTQKKSHLTGAVSSLKNEGLEEIPASRADQALRGKLAGVQILNYDPEAGAASSVRPMCRKDIPNQYPSCRSVQK